MVYEKLDLGVDVQRLRQHLNEKVLPLPPVMQSDFFGGWSVLSSTGSYTDGWHAAASYFEEKEGKIQFNMEEARKALGDIKDEHHYTRPTEICTGYLAEVMAQLSELGLSPARARVSVLKVGGRTNWHRDGPPELYRVRLHIPLVTNTGCIFACDDGEAHLPADGSVYFLAVNRMHQVFNWGDTDRYHIIMNVWDTKHVSQHHRFFRQQ